VCARLREDPLSLQAHDEIEHATVILVGPGQPGLASARRCDTIARAIVRQIGAADHRYPLARALDNRGGDGPQRLRVAVRGHRHRKNSGLRKEHLDEGDLNLDRMLVSVGRRTIDKACVRCQQLPGEIAIYGDVSQRRAPHATPVE